MALKRPIPGQQYIVRLGDTLESIAIQAYGDGTLSGRIVEANQITEPDELFPDRILIIPRLPEDANLKTKLSVLTVAGQDKYDLLIVVNGIEIRPQAARIRRQLDTCADGWTATIPWLPGVDNKIDEIVRPYSYWPAAAYIGGELLVNGILYTTSPKSTATGVSVDLSGWSYSVDTVDSTLQPPYERDDETLQDAAELLVRPLGIRAIFETDPGEPFVRMTADEGETIFAHLAKYASQRGILISSAVTGDLLFLRADATQKVIGSIDYDQPLATDWAAMYDGRKLFNTYRVVGQSPGSGDKAVTITDDRVPRSRFLTFRADDTTDTDISTTVEWRRSKQLAEALTISLPVTDWYVPKTNILWREGKLVTVRSDVLGIKSGYKFLIKSVEFEVTDSGRSARLDLVPPAVYTGEKIEYPWR